MGAHVTQTRILVINGKGGCGKTTVTVTIASALAKSGGKVALADVDRQQSALGWLALRPTTYSKIEGIDWRKDQIAPPQSIDHLLIDAPAGLRVREAEALLQAAELVVVPVQASPYDEAATARFLSKLEELKPIRKGRKSVIVVANRVRARAKANQRLEHFLAEINHPPVTRIGDRAIYGDLAAQGLGLFDLETKEARSIALEWTPLLEAIRS